MDFQTIILKLQKFWAGQNCIMAQPYDIEKGAGTMNPSTFLRVLGPEPWRVAYVEPSRRPADGRYGDNPNRLFQHHQFQVIVRPSPENIQELYLQSLAELIFIGQLASQRIPPLIHDQFIQTVCCLLRQLGLSCLRHHHPSLFLCQLLKSVPAS